MGDDGVGIHVVRRLKEELGSQANFEFKELSVSGLRLIEEMLRYDRVIIIDSIESKDKKTGQICEYSPDQFKETEQAVAPHITNFGTALELYKKLEPAGVPSEIRIFTISIEPKLTFSEEMSEPVRAAAKELVKKIALEVQRTPSQSK